MREELLLKQWKTAQLNNEEYFFDSACEWLREELSIAQVGD